MWLKPNRQSPTFAYGLRSSDPLSFDDTVSWFTRSGVEKRLVGVDTVTANGLRWRGRGLLSLVSSDWSIAGVSEEEDLMAIRFARTIATPAGVDVLVREGTMIEDIRADLADGPHWLGLSDAEVGTLTWLRDSPN